MTAFNRWTARHDRAVAALLTSASIRQAADRAGVGERTLRRWLREPLFTDRLAVAQREAQDVALGEVRGLAGAAVRALRRALTCEQPAVELRAAVEVLELGLRLRELERIWDPSIEEVERLIARTEREIAQRQQDQDQGPPWIAA
jgi:transposase